MEHFSSLMPHFFEYINRVLKEVRMTLCRTDVLHHCNKLLVCLNSKLDELKEFHKAHIEKKCIELG